MDRDNKESKGRGTLLHVIKQDPNDWVSSLKKSMELAPRPTNHLITTSPKLDGNTLHIKALFLECTAILWLKWLTCSTGSVRPLYIVNVGWVNYRRSLPPSILCVKGDLEIWLSALLIASFPRPLKDEFLFLHSWWTSLSYEKDSLRGVFDLRLWLPSSSSSKEKLELEGSHFRHSWHKLLFKWSISNYMALVFFSWERWLPPREWLLLVWVVCTLPSRFRDLL